MLTAFRNCSKTGHRMLEVAQQLAAAGVPVFPCTTDKNPAIPKGTSWRDASTVPPDQLYWPSGLAGIPIPQGVTVIDLDTYKGATRQQVEQALGCQLPWDQALIQYTQNGGEHYAFAVDWEVIQGSELFNIDGFDTRTAGKGYICTGEGYPWQGCGPLRMGQPGALPSMPEAARDVMERRQREVTAIELPQGDRDVDLIREALRHISSDCSRTEWVSTGMALKHQFHDTQDTGFALFKEWSEYHAERLDYETLEQQWGSFKPYSADGASITIATVIYKAMQAGWQPPADVDTALAFGEDAATVQTFGVTVDLITENGGNPKMTGDLIEVIKSTPCSEIQKATLLATLYRELKDAGLLTKQVRAALDTALTGRQAPAEGTGNIQGQYSKNHYDNAQLFCLTQYPNDTLLRSDETWYKYTGLSWEEVKDSRIKADLYACMSYSRPQEGTSAGTYSGLVKRCHTDQKIGQIAPNLVIYLNGVLNLDTWELSPHSPEHFTTNILPYNYNPYASCSTWMTFLSQVFEGDNERIELLQEWLGYMLSNSYGFQKMMLLIGPTRSGKGTIIKVLEYLSGEQNFSAGSLYAFASDKFIESLRTKTVMSIGDTGPSIPRHQVGTIIERMKTISGNDAITFDRIYKSSVTETLPTRITIAANHTPSLFDDSGALAGRFLVLPINVTFFDCEDRYLLNKLTAELEGIAAWSLAGLRRLNTVGRFTQPQASLDEMQYVKETYSPLSRFVDDACAREPESVTSTEDMYNAYRAWATLQQEDNILPRRTFTSAFKDTTRGQFKYGTHRSIGCGRGFKGVQLREAGQSVVGTAAAFKVVK